MARLTLQALGLGAALLSGAVAGRSADKVLLRDVSALTLRRGEFTTHRRVSPVPQLSCTRGCNSGNTPDEIQCLNTGFDGADVNWKCDANLPMGQRLTHTNIQCEGYDYPDDPYVLVGSCGASFELEQSKYEYMDEDSRYNRQRQGSRSRVTYDERAQGWSWVNIIMVLFVGFIFWNVFCGGSGSGGAAPAAPAASRGWGGGWGGGRGSSWGSGWSSPFGGGGGGFFSGLGLGSMLGSMWSRPRR
jgi:hypothetical protein